MSFFNRTSGPGADHEPIGAEALRGQGGVPVAPPASSPPASTRRDASTVAPPPATPAYDSPASVAHVEYQEQVATLEAAAEEGLPFCEECQAAAK